MRKIKKQNHPIKMNQINIEGIVKNKRRNRSRASSLKLKGNSSDRSSISNINSQLIPLSFLLTVSHPSSLSRIYIFMTCIIKITIAHLTNQTNIWNKSKDSKSKALFSKITWILRIKCLYLYNKILCQKSKDKWVFKRSRMGKMLWLANCHRPLNYSKRILKY